MNVPARLRSADIKRFASRAAQVESLKPPIAYWCYYWIVQHILSNGLHNTDDAAKVFTTNLMDKLEEMKLSYAADDAITDDVAGQAYVEQFGLETFQRGENAMLANKASRQTADTFQASATFLELVNIWGAPSPEIASKIKYAKFHALRIAKAVNAGDDPNLSNPVPDPQPAANAVPLDPNDPEVRQINGTDEQSSIAEDPGQLKPDPVLAAQKPQSAKTSQPGSSLMWPPTRNKQPSVMDVPDEHDGLPKTSTTQPTLNETQPSPKPSSIPPSAPMNKPAESTDTSINPGAPALQTRDSSHESPLPPRPESANRQASTEGGYFPSVTLPKVPDASKGSAAPPIGLVSPQGDPMSPSDRLVSPRGGLLPRQGGPTSPTGNDQPASYIAGTNNPQAFYTSAPDLSRPAEESLSPMPPIPPAQQQIVPTSPHQPQIPHQIYPQPYQPTIQSQSSSLMQSTGPQTYLTDDIAVLAAQRHAKFAISALNFEDVPTAVKELREALKSLGAG